MKAPDRSLHGKVFALLGIQILLNLVQKGFGICNLFHNLSLGDYEEIVVVTFLTDVKKCGYGRRQRFVENAGLDIKAAELRHNAAVVLHINSIQGKNRAHRMENCIIRTICSPLIIVCSQQDFCGIQAIVSTGETSLGQSLLPSDAGAVLSAG